MRIYPPPFPRAAEQTIAADDFTLAHNGASVLLLTHAAASTLYTSSAVKAIADGVRVGQTLRIVIASLAGGAGIKILDDGNTDLIGPWWRKAVQDSLTVVWDGSKWGEVDRNRVGIGSDAWGVGSVIEGYAVDGYGDYCHAEGVSTSAAGDGSHAEGNAASAGGDASHAEGGSTAAGGDYAHAEGYDVSAAGEASHAQGNRAMASLFAQDAHACGAFTTIGDAQRTRFVMRHAMVAADTTDWKELIQPARFAIVDEKAYACTVTIAGRQDTGAHHAMYKRMVVIERTAGTVALAGAVQSIGTDIETDAAWDVQLTADDTNKSLKIEVKGNSQNVHWVAHVEAVEIAYAD
ncbi:MAG TPA: hypothetical protein VMW52_05650 [Phycisphaerae bacterium]|nr:hypothetical protein [Phycisphaerae bacterium]